MTEETELKFKVFISYSWTTPELENWVLELAERLVLDGIDVVLDKWNLKKGQDKYVFMEQSVTDPTINKVLIILDKGYAEKADNRRGGVGTEAQIISPEVYSEVKQEKFIPIIYERDEHNEIYAPSFLKSRIYIDLSNENTFEDEFEILERTIANKPLHKKPPLGKLPNYLLNDTETRSKTSILLQRFDNILKNKPKLINSSIKEYLDEFLPIFNTFTFKVEDTSLMVVGKQIFDILDNYLPQKNEFVLFFDKLFRANEDFDSDLIIEFLEQAYSIKINTKTRYNAETEPIEFALNELFLSLIALSYKYKNYLFIGELIYSKYKIRDSIPRLVKHSFVIFYQYIQDIGSYYNQLKLTGQTYHNPAAALLIERITTPLTKELVVEADLICYYLSELFDIRDTGFTRERWFPNLYIYKEDHQPDIITSLTSKRHFERVKTLFNCSTPEELITKLKEYENKNKDKPPINYGRTYIRNLHTIIDADTIASER